MPVAEIPNLAAAKRDVGWCWHSLWIQSPQSLARRPRKDVGAKVDECGVQVIDGGLNLRDGAAVRCRVKIKSVRFRPEGGLREADTIRIGRVDGRERDLLEHMTWDCDGHHAARMPVAKESLNSGRRNGNQGF